MENYEKPVMEVEELEEEDAILFGNTSFIPV